MLPINGGCVKNITCQVTTRPAMSRYQSIVDLYFMVIIFDILLIFLQLTSFFVILHRREGRLHSILNNILTWKRISIWFNTNLLKFLMHTQKVWKILRILIEAKYFANPFVFSWEQYLSAHIFLTKRCYNGIVSKGRYFK